ncbi:hypothetical protein DUI87_01424 [Hirundo rustica rustica]|uniref:Uncharacterized protein n=1 Tax=Hirundo rustica rustica TaxID=333673 RepID=A0A3M0L5J5_HIRRU|nr:hypothetical protein DUI87_01424 [Hirundo rustica rustica]
MFGDVCTEYHKNQTKITPPVPRKAVITKMPAIPEVEEQITPVVTKIGPYAIKKTGVQKLIVNPKWSLKRVEMGVQSVVWLIGSTRLSQVYQATEFSRAPPGQRQGFGGGPGITPITSGSPEIVINEIDQIR